MGLRFLDRDQVVQERDDRVAVRGDAGAESLNQAYHYVKPHHRLHGILNAVFVPFYPSIHQG